MSISALLEEAGKVVHGPLLKKLLRDLDQVVSPCGTFQFHKQNKNKQEFKIWITPVLPANEPEAPVPATEPEAPVPATEPEPPVPDIKPNSIALTRIVKLQSLLKNNISSLIVAVEGVEKETQEKLIEQTDIISDAISKIVGLVKSMIHPSQPSLFEQSQDFPHE